MTWLNRFFRFFEVNVCLLCNKSLPEEGLCWQCWRKLQLLAVDRINFNAIQQNIHLIFKVHHFLFLFFFEKKSPFLHLIHLLKYKNKPNIGFLFGRVLGFLLPKDIPNSVLVPVPLHPEKLQKRGYNQSKKIAEGISSITQVPLKNDWVIRKTDTNTQTQKDAGNRLENTSQIFEILVVPEDNTHIILVDDVFTTGSTIEALGLAFLQRNPNISISIAVLVSRSKSEP